jgi:hypothetical protein
MDSNTAMGYGVLGMVAIVIGVILSLLWILIPFAIFGIKPRLETLIAEQRRGNQLAETIVNQNAQLFPRIESAARPVIVEDHRPVIGDTVVRRE